MIDKDGHDEDQRGGSERRTEQRADPTDPTDPAESVAAARGLADDRGQDRDGQGDADGQGDEDESDGDAYDPYDAYAYGYEEDEGGPEGLDDLFLLLPLIPPHLVLPVMELLELSPLEALRQPWREEQSPSYGTLGEAVIASGDRELIDEALHCQPISPLVLLRDGVALLNELADPRRADIAAAMYRHPEAEPSLRHALARGPIGTPMAHHLLRHVDLSANELRPLLATGDAGVARSVLRLPAEEVTAEEQAQAALQLVDGDHREEWEELWAGGGEHLAHLAPPVRAVLAGGSADTSPVPDAADDPRVVALRRLVEETGTPAHLARLLEERFDGAQGSAAFIRHSPHLHDLAALAETPLPRETRRQVVSAFHDDCPREVVHPLLDHRDVSSEDDLVLATCQHATEMGSAEVVIQRGAPLSRFLGWADPTRDASAHAFRDRLARTQLDEALREALREVPGATLLGAARIGPDFDGTLPELLVAGASHPGTGPLDSDRLELLHLLLHFAPASVSAEVLAEVTAQEALDLARYSARWLTTLPTPRQKEGGRDAEDHQREERAPHDSVLATLAHTRRDAAVRTALAEAAVRAADEAVRPRPADRTVLLGAVLTALESGEAPGVREQAEAHLPDAADWLAGAEARRRAAQAATRTGAVGLHDLRTAPPPPRVGDVRTEVAWDELLASYRAGEHLPLDHLAPLLYRPDLPEALRPLVLTAHPELLSLPRQVSHPYGVTPPRWLVWEVLPDWEHVAFLKWEALVSVVQSGLVDAEDLVGRLAPAGHAAAVLESVHRIRTVRDLAPRCRAVIAERVPGSGSAVFWAEAVRQVAARPRGTLLDAFRASAAAAPM